MKKRYTDEWIIGFLRQAEAGTLRTGSSPDPRPWLQHSPMPPVFLTVAQRNHQGTCIVRDS